MSFWVKYIVLISKLYFFFSKKKQLLKNVTVGVIESPVGESINNCVWLLHTETDAEISLTCDIINLPNCLVSYISLLSAV